MAASLNQVPGVRMCWRELFNPNNTHRIVACEQEGVPLEGGVPLAPQAESAWFNDKVLPALAQDCETHYGYKIIDASFYKRPEIVPLALGDTDMKVVVMSRNPMAVYISNCVCMADNVWVRTLDEGPLASQTPIFNEKNCAEFVNRTGAFWQMVTGMPWARAIVTYQELMLDYQGTMQKVCEFLGTEWTGAEKPLSRTRPEMVKDRVPDTCNLWPFTPSFWGRDMYEVLAEEECPEGPHV